MANQFKVTDGNTMVWRKRDAKGNFCLGLNFTIDIIRCVYGIDGNNGMLLKIIHACSTSTNDNEKVKPCPVPVRPKVIYSPRLMFRYRHKRLYQMAGRSS